MCELLGWDYRLVGAPDAITTANVRWLAGYRHPRHDRPVLAAVLREVFAAPGPLMAGAQAAGDPIAVLPVLFHLLWRHELAVDLIGAAAARRPVVTAQRRDQRCGGVMASPRCGSGAAPGDWVASTAPTTRWSGWRGVSVRLRSAAGAEMVVLAGISAGLADVRGDRRGAGMPAVEPFGLLDGLPEEVLAAAQGVAAPHRRGRDRAAAGRSAGDDTATGVRPGGHDRAATRGGQGRRAGGRGPHRRADARPLCRAGPVGAGGPARRGTA